MIKDVLLLEIRS